jgi:hypothetical protein
MKKYFIILFSLITTIISCQVKNYTISNNMGLATFPYKVYNSNDGNILLSNAEANVDGGYSNVLKVKPNGDTIFIKSTENLDLFVTSTANILTNSAEFDILTQSYLTSYLTMYDKNYNTKWQLDLKDNSIYFPNNMFSYSHIQGFNITTFLELNNNHYKAFANTTIGGPMGAFYIKVEFDFDSLGNVLPGRWYYPYSSNEFINEAKNQIGGFDNSFVFYYNLANFTFQIFDFGIAGIFPVFKSGIFINNKIYLAGTFENRRDSTQTYKKAFLACIDTTAHVNWCKMIVPADSTVNNEFTDLIKVNNKLLCKYKSDTSTFVLNLDTLGQLLNSNQMETKNGITNFIQFDNNIYTSKLTISQSQQYISLVKMDTLGYYSCAAPYSFNFVSAPLNLFNIYTESSQAFALTYTLSNQTYNLNSYTVTLSDGCNYTTSINEINNSGINNFSVFPNPTSSLINIEMAENAVVNKVYEIKITNAIGEIVYASTILNKKLVFSIQQLSNGIYFLSLYEGNYLRETKKIVKQ